MLPQMDKRKRRRRKIMLISVEAFVAASLVALYVHSILRKRREGITCEDHPMDGDLLDKENDGVEDTSSTNEGGESSVNRPPKKTKIANDNDMLISCINQSLDNLAKAVEKVCTADTNVLGDLWDNMKDLPGFEEAHLAHYYAYLYENVAIARAFNKLSMSNKMIWVARYIKNHLSA